MRNSFFFCSAGPLLLPNFSLVEVSEGYSLGAVHRLLTGVASLIAVHRLQSTVAIVVVPRLSCSMACGILLDQGLNPCLLHWQAILCH